MAKQGEVAWSCEAGRCPNVRAKDLIIRLTFALESDIRTCYLDGWHTFALASDMLRSQLLKLSVFATELGLRALRMSGSHGRAAWRHHR